MSPSKTEKASDDTYYPDVLTLDTNNFTFTSSPEEYYLTKSDILRPDILFYNKYGFPDFYDLIIEINGIGYIKDCSPGDTILLPSLTDLENFYAKNRK
jgi:hypothetical protein